jgi:hypothetical protein
MDRQPKRYSTEHVAPFTIDEELFRPTLSESDDAVGFDQPWNPWSLVVMTFFFGVTAGVGLLAFNYQRLGIKGRLYTTLAFALVLELLLTAVHVWAVRNGMIIIDNRGEEGAVRVAMRIVSVVAAILVAQTQRKRFELFRHSRSKAGHLLKPALLAIVAGLGVDAVKTAIILPLIKP